MSKRGLGSVYLRGTTWWIRYSHRGQEYRESSESESETVARKLLKARIAETGKRGAKFLGPAEERVRFEDLARMIVDDYTVNELRSLKRVNASLRNLRATFGQDRAVDITSDLIKSYKASRRESGAANATINRELAALKRMFKLAVDAERLSRAPHIEMLDENNARQGFIEHADFIALKAALPERIRDLLSFLYLSGWRTSEGQNLEWRDVNLAGNVVRLPPEKSKNKDGRPLPLSGELAEIIERAHSRRRLDCPYVFHNDGKRIADYRGAWKAACAAVGLSGLTPHDFRRSAVRNLVRAGVPERVAMAISGHKTRAVFDRYNIVSEADLAAAVERRDQYLDTRPSERKITRLVR